MHTVAGASRRGAARHSLWPRAAAAAAPPGVGASVGRTLLDGGGAAQQMQVAPGAVIVAATRAMRTLGWHGSGAAAVLAGATIRGGQAAGRPAAAAAAAGASRSYALLHLRSPGPAPRGAVTLPNGALHTRLASALAALRDVSPSAGRRLLALSVPLLLAASTLPAPGAPHATPATPIGGPSGSRELARAAGAAGGGDSGAPHGLAARLAGELATAGRALYLLALFTPLALLAAPCMWLGWGRDLWMGLLGGTLQRAGPAFIKWGQWAATRPDMFPPDMCATLETLQTQAPAHSAAFSVAAVEGAFGAPLAELFDSFDDAPVASGSIAQVHRATLSAGGAARTGLPRGSVVAIKVRHPGVEGLMARDFELMERLAAACSAVPRLAALRVEDSIRQFGAPLKEQLDLTREAANLARFNHNFRGWPNLSFPRPILPLVAPGVLVESYEEGVLISSLVRQPDGRDSIHVANTGMRSYLQMLLQDNFVHADLHPGNILVRAAPQASGAAERLGARLRAAGRWALGLPPGGDDSPHVVLLDVGMVAEMSRLDKLAVMDFFQSVSSLDGAKVAESITRFSSNVLPAPAQLAFVEDMTAMFDRIDEARMREFTQEVIGDMLETIRQHGVSIRGTVSTLLVTTMVLEGWSTKLHPDIRILESIKEVLPGDWNDRISRLVDKLVLSGEIATA
mmetsp:Transcript_45749/g.115661  ORF Transcript_45749/g.115661 Transcript_45749/m.115661 type:complete len:683 (-) Transcript_45749:139-2187(-)